MTSKTLKLVPIGGLGEVGKNMMAVEYGDNILIVDCGIMFPENDMLGIDYIIPDFGYLKDRLDKIRGIVFTHGHEDHIGAVGHLFELVQAPIYATRLTIGLLEIKLSRSGSLDKASLNTVEAGEQVNIGPFSVELFHVSHSIPDAVGLGITTPAGLIIHTGDYKFDYTPVDGWPSDFTKLGEFGSRGVLALLADSTNADKPGWTPSEAVIDPALDRVFREAEGRILVGSFASHISRMEQVAHAAARHGRSIVFVGRSMVDNAKMSRKLGYLDVPEDLIINLDQALSMEPSKVVLMCTGTQGEPYSILGRLSTGTNRQFDIHSGDTVVLSSHTIPGNEEMVHRTINRLFRRGAHVIYEDIAPIHVSGHASQEEMKLMLQLVNPQFFIPIHGELRHLKQHAALAREIGMPAERIAVIENGTVVEFRNGEMKVAERHPGGHVFVDGYGVGDVGPAVMRERETLAKDGFVAVHLPLDPQNGALRRAPEIISKGFVFLNASDELMEEARALIEREVERPNGDSPVEARVQEQLSRFFYAETRRRPILVVFRT